MSNVTNVCKVFLIKPLLIISLIILIWSVIANSVYAENYREHSSGTEAAAAMTLDEHLQRQMSKIDLSEVNIFLKQLDEQTGQYMPSLDLFTVLAKIRRGELPIDPGEAGRGLLKYFFYELITSAALLGQLLILAIACAVLNNLKAAFNEGSISTLARGVAYLALITLALASFTVAAGTGKEAVDRMITFFQSLLPVLVTLIAASGGITTTALLQPVLIYAVTILGTMMHNFLFPLLYLAAVLTVISQITDRFQISKMASLLKQVALWILGLMMTVFTGVLSVYGIAGSVADGVGLRTIEFATGAFLPVVGGMLADAVGTIAGTTLLLKSVISIVGVFVIFYLAAFPMLKILSVVIVYKVTAAVIQPFGEEQLADALDGIGGALTMIFACVAVTGLMFFMAIAVIIVMGNLTLALRG